MKHTGKLLLAVKLKAWLSSATKWLDRLFLLTVTTNSSTVFPNHCAAAHTCVVRNHQVYRALDFQGAELHLTERWRVHISHAIIPTSMLEQCFPTFRSHGTYFTLERSHGTSPNKKITKSKLIIFPRAPGIAELVRFDPSIAFMLSCNHYSC